MDTTTNVDGKNTWKKIVASYSTPDLSRSIWQLVNTLIPFLGLFYLSMPITGWQAGMS